MDVGIAPGAGEGEEGEGSAGVGMEEMNCCEGDACRCAGSRD
jgi:hypothetical protein